MGELVLIYDIKSNNQTSEPRAFHALYIYIGPNDAGTGHSVFKLANLLSPKADTTLNPLAL